MALLFIPSPPSALVPPPALPVMLPLFTWGKLTILTGIMDSRSLGEERRGEMRAEVALGYEVLEGLNLIYLIPENMLDGTGIRG